VYEKVTCQFAKSRLRILTELYLTLPFDCPCSDCVKLQAYVALQKLELNSLFPLFEMPASTFHSRTINMETYELQQGYSEIPYEELPDEVSPANPLYKCVKL
jgi:hypothetical protein